MIKGLYFGLLLLGMVNAHALPPGTSERNDLEKVFGPDDRVEVSLSNSNVPARFRPLIDAFGILLPMGCTATHLGNGFVLTAGHCFEASAFVEKNTGCSGITVEWGFREHQPNNLLSKCTQVIVKQQSDKKGADFALFKVNKWPKAKVSIDFQKRLKTGDSFTLFSHSELRPLQWSKYCTIESAVQNHVSGPFFFHHCDTMGGSSGAAILDSTTGKIIGVHDGGWEDPQGWNYGTPLQNTPLEALLQ